MGKLVIITAPSGAGKSTIVKHLLTAIPQLVFAISATTRAPRPHETQGKEYYFIHNDQFKQYIQQRRFIEWEEVYAGQFYGTLKSEFKRIWDIQKVVLDDIDVKGATDLKRVFPKKSLAIFIKPPSIEVLKQRLEARNTETPEKIATRIQRATMEMQYEDRFDTVLLNDDLEHAKAKAVNIVNRFILGQ